MEKLRSPRSIGILTTIFILLLCGLVGCTNGSLGLRGGSISGSVLDSRTLVGIADVNVIAVSGDESNNEGNTNNKATKYAKTDSNGKYYFSDMRSDEWKLSFDRVGYEPITAESSGTVKVVVVNGETSYVPQVRMVQNYANQYITVKGTLKDAVTGATLTYGNTNIIIGKEAFTLLGEYTPQMIKKVVLGINPPEFNKIEEQIPARPPVMCTGCPHRGTFYTLKKLGLTVSGDIGCYTLGAVEPLGSVDSTICMGASVSAAFGMAKARGKEFAKKLVSVIGDSTFIHSGITGLIDIVYNKGINTVIILDNSITGMTGHQQNPTTGKTIRMEDTIPVNLIELAHSIGIKRVTVCDPFDVKKFEAVVKEETQVEEPSVIIAQRPCALLKTVKYVGHCQVTDKCKKCKQCMKLGCPAISIVDGNIIIDENQCNGCGLCVNVCPFNAIEKVGA